jgi:hypothetical protein
MEPAASSTVPAQLVSSIATLFAALLASYVFLLAPGQAWFRGRAASTPRLFARVVLSALFTTVMGLGLAAFETFSLPRLAVIGALGALVRLRVGGQGAPRRARRRGAVGRRPAGLPAGPLPVLASVRNPSGGFGFHVLPRRERHLARAHRLWKHDDLSGELSPSRDTPCSSRSWDIRGSRRIRACRAGS